MRRVIGCFSHYLDKFSKFLENASRRRQRRYAYFFCVTQILVSVFGILIATAFFVQYFPKLPSLGLRFLGILALLLCLFLLGAHIHMIITRDMKHIRSQGAHEKQEPAKKNKIEF